MLVSKVAEVWFRGEDARDPLLVAQPWDLFILAMQGITSSHVGIVIDAELFVHTRRRTGVVLEPMRRWRPKLLQIARLTFLA